MDIKRYTFTIALPLIVIVVLTVNVLNGDIYAFDEYIYSLVAGIISDDLTFIMKVITFLASGTFLCILSALLVLSILFKKGMNSFYTAVQVINITLSSLLNVGVKNLICRSRPNILQLMEVTGYSFPSGHSMASMSFYGFAIYLCCRFYKGKYKDSLIILLAILIVLIGFSRIYLGVHYTSDVIGGFAFGLLWLGLFTIMIEKLKEKLL